MWSKNKKRLLLATLAGVLLLALAGVLIGDLLFPYLEAKSTMDPTGTLTILTRDDGTMQVQWPAGENAQSYALQILEQDGTALYSCVAADCSAQVPQLPSDRELTVRVSSCHGFGFWTRTGEKCLETTVNMAPPEISAFVWSADEETDTVSVSFDMTGSDLCRVFFSAGEEVPAQIGELTQGELELRFGEGERFAIPAHDQLLHLTFRPERREGQAYFQGSGCSITLTRDDFLTRQLDVQCVQNSDNTYTLTWSETKGAQYEVLLSTDGGESWKRLAVIPWDQPRTFTTDRLEPYTDYTFWVVSTGGQTMPDSEFAAVSQPLQLRTGAQLLYCTIWPLMDQKVFADPEATQELGTVTAGSAWCVIGIEGNYLKIRYQQQDAYIDGDYCMINLPEYVGALCRYDITNSYASKYLVHEFGIDGVSGSVIAGYENVRVREGEYVVPLLFPTAQKLIKAAETAAEAGYRLKIYDSYRPKIATEDIYARTSRILKNLVPASTYTGKYVSIKPPPSDWKNEDGVEETPPFDYWGLMTNYGEYSLGMFLAPGTSKHNYGIAMDLTLEDSGGNELTMQTSMHDLSWYSAFKRNNANANLLYKIMSGAGLAPISSEWWHYQDNEVYDTHQFQPLRIGVSLQCWVCDCNGWRYRLPDGSFYTDCTQTIAGQPYTFDGNGYVTNGVG